MKHTACARNFITLTLLALLAIQQMSDALTWVPQMSKYPEQTPRPPTLKLNHLGHAVCLAAEMKASLGQSPHIMGRYTLLPLIGLGPHSSKKKQDLDKLYELKSKVWQIMNQFGPSALINLSNFSSIKPEAASTPLQGSMANSTTVVKIPGTPGTGSRLNPENNQVLTKKKLQDFVREVDPNEQLDEDVEEMLLQNADDFIESVVTAACQLARH